MLTEHNFTTNIPNWLVKKSRYKAVDRELQLISGWLECAACAVDDAERLLGVKEWWQQGDTEYQKMLEYISSRKFVCIVEELQGLVMSRLIELDKVNLAGSGIYLMFSIQWF